MKRLGFGMMRLPLKDGKIDREETKKMVDLFIERGFIYFDTAYGYLDNESELAVKECLSDRYPRSAYLLTDKLTIEYVKDADDVVPFFENQLKRCGVEYFDNYLHHSLDRKNYEVHKKYGAFEKVKKLKEEGKIRHIGLSFHDSPEVLDKILSEQKHIELVQLQINFLDMYDPKVESKACYEICKKHNKPVLVMEPIKGGSLVKGLPVKAKEKLTALSKSPAELALRYVAELDQVKVILSGMSSLDQIRENTDTMKDPRPLTDAQRRTMDETAALLHKMDLIACTACGYCLDGCPSSIPIPDIMNALNNEKIQKGDGRRYYDRAVEGKGRAEDCIECGHCQGICPQEIKIIENLKKAQEVFS